ncbi:unnamed protein product [Ectocarpus sp. 12 AP-2014]
MKSDLQGTIVQQTTLCQHQKWWVRNISPRGFLLRVVLFPYPPCLWYIRDLKVGLGGGAISPPRALFPRQRGCQNQAKTFLGWYSVFDCLDFCCRFWLLHRAIFV